MMNGGLEEKETKEVGLSRWQCRIAGSLGDGFAGTPEKVWGTTVYKNQDDPTVFFGLYGLPDFYALWRHKGKKAILWAGSDILHFTNGYWLDERGDIKVDPTAFANWIRLNCTNYVENTTEAQKLAEVGIHARVIPSFLGDVSDYDIQPIQPKKYYTSVSGDDFELYGWNELWKYAKKHPDTEFHLYGNRREWVSYYPNIIVHGRVTQEQMNSEIKHMTGALRLTKFDGFSEILAKSILWGQWPVSPFIPYPFIDSEIQEHTGNNVEGREYYLRSLNQYPFNVHNQ